MIMTPAETPALMYYENIVPLIPSMTSNTSPSGVASDNLADANAFKAFPNSTYWTLGMAGTFWIQYAFPLRMRVTKIYYQNIFTINSSTLTILVQGSNDATNWTTLGTLYLYSYPSSQIASQNISAFNGKFFRWTISGLTGTDLTTSGILPNCQLYGYK